MRLDCAENRSVRHVAMPDWCANSRSSWVKLGTIKRKVSGIVGPGKPNDEGEIPIGVKRARERLNLPSDGSGVSEVAGPSTGVPVVVREGRITSALAGLPVQRLRRECPTCGPGSGKQMRQTDSSQCTAACRRRRSNAVGTRAI